MDDDTLRVLTWNVRNHLGDPLAVIRVLRGSDADVVLLQEVTRWPFSRYRLTRLARDAGLRFACGGRASAGTAVMVGSRVTVDHADAYRLPVAGWRTRPRGLATAVVSRHGAAAVRVMSIHLGLDEAERAGHTAAVIGVLAEGPPSVVAGDLNEPPTGPSWAALTAHLADTVPDGGPTFPAARPRVRIDALLADPGLAVESADSAGALDDADVRAASDHIPVLAVLRLPQRRAGGRVPAA